MRKIASTGLGSLPEQLLGVVESASFSTCAAKLDELNDLSHRAYPHV